VKPAQLFEGKRSITTYL